MSLMLWKTDQYLSKCLFFEMVFVIYYNIQWIVGPCNIALK